MLGTRGRDLHEARAAPLLQLSQTDVDMLDVRIELRRGAANGDFAWCACAIPIRSTRAPLCPKSTCGSNQERGRLRMMTQAMIAASEELRWYHLEGAAACGTRSILGAQEEMLQTGVKREGGKRWLDDGPTERTFEA